VGGENSQREGYARQFPTPGPDLAAPEQAQALCGHLVAFDRHPDLGCATAEPDQHSLCGAALVDGDEIAPQHDVVDLRRALADGPAGSPMFSRSTTRCDPMRCHNLSPDDNRDKTSVSALRAPADVVQLTRRQG
jgi:hypothetical protein